MTSTLMEPLFHLHRELACRSEDYPRINREDIVDMLVNLGMVE